VRSAHWLVTLRICALIALAASAALFVDYTAPSPAYCSPGAGCSVVRASGFGYVLGVPVPLIGLLGFGGMYAVSLASSRLRDRFLAPMAYAGAVAAVVFIALQAVIIHAFCVYCVVVDTTAIATAGAAYGLSRALRADKTAKLRDPLRPIAWALLCAIAIGAPLLWPKVQPQPKVPPSIRALYVPGKINVIEFADFQCPFCRMLHPLLNKVIKDYPGRVNFVRLNMPLSRHPQAQDAARAYVCAKAQGKGDEMAEALFEAEDLRTGPNRRLALHLGLDPKPFDACITDEKTDKAINRESAILRGAGFQGLPTTYVGSATIVGAQSEEVFRDAFERAARGEGNDGIPAWMFLGISAAAVAAALALGRRRKGT
jgi:predicted DsbA family dithiol-disulfide isomerase/uncharacterized membrane protein